MPSPPIIDIQLLARPVHAMAIDSFPEHAGGECLFLGRTRAESHPAHGDLIRLDYDAYQPMAIAAMRMLADRAAEQYGCFVVRMHHAIGPVPVGDASVMIQVACGHRAEAFDACRMLIDQLKSEVPIWKQEVWADGTTWSEGTPVNTAGSS